MRVYVAGKVTDLATVQSVQGMVRHTGHTISFDWVPMVRKYGGKPETTPPEVRREAAVMDLTGVSTSDLLIAIGHPDLNGTLWECGMAGAWGIPTWLVFWERCARHSIFEDLPNVKHMTLQKVGEELWAVSEKRLEKVAPTTVISPADD